MANFKFPHLAAKFQISLQCPGKGFFNPLFLCIGVYVNLVFRQPLSRFDQNLDVLQNPVFYQDQQIKLVFLHTKIATWFLLHLFILVKAMKIIFLSKRIKIFKKNFLKI